VRIDEGGGNGRDASTDQSAAPDWNGTLSFQIGPWMKFARATFSVDRY
jgi:hypothetical protein